MKVRAILAFVIGITTAMAGQTFRGEILGQITDAKGAAIDEAKVTATNTLSGLIRDTLTDIKGQYALSELPLGTYKITVVKTGFRSPTLTDIHLVLTRPARVDLSLAPGDVEQKSEQMSVIPAVNSLTNTLGGALEGAEISQLPLNGRDYKKLLTSVPGSTQDFTGENDSPGSPDTVAVNGNRGRSNYFLLDGANINDPYRNTPAINASGASGAPATLLPLDSIQEMAVLTTNDPQYGRKSGAVANLVTRAGQNELHGSIFEYFRNDALDARNYFNAAPAPRDIFHNNQFGGSAGGAITPDKTFWFLGYEGQRERVSSPESVTVPSQAQILASAPACGAVNPMDCVNPIIRNILSFDPWGAVPQIGDAPGNPASAHTFQTTLPTTNRSDNAIGKIDYHLFASDLVTARYFFGYGKQNAPFGVQGGAGLLPGYNTTTPTRVHDGALSYTHVFSQKMLVELRGTWNRFFDTFSPSDLSFVPSAAGLNTTTNPNDYGLPVINVGGFTTIGTNQSIPRGRRDTSWAYATNFAYNTGRHTWRFGADYDRASVNQYFDLNHRGTLSFATLNDFLAAIPAGGSRTFGDTHRTTNQSNFAFYIQDSFRFTSRTTVNGGLRWDYFGVIGEDNGLLSIFDPSVGLQQIGATNAPSGLYPKDKNNFSPHLGVAYDVFGTGSTILRAGWAMLYDQFAQDIFAGQMAFNTSNAGPAYNDIGLKPVLFGTVDPFAFQVTPGPCTGAQIAVPNTASCTGPVYSNFTASDVFTVSKKLRTPYVQNYNVNVEHGLGGHTTITIGYVGSLGRKLLRYRDINQPNSATGVRPLDFGPFTTQGTQYRIVNQLESAANSRYNSVQGRLRVRNLRGFSSTLNYTYSHAIDNASNALDYVPNASLPDNSFNPGGERSNSNFDARHRLTWLFTYKLPSNGSFPLLTSGWGLHGIITLSSGMPFTVNDFNVINTFQLNPNAPVGEFIERPDVIANPLGNRGPAQYLDLSAFKAPCSVAPTFVPAAGVYECLGGTPHYGSEGRNQFYGPHYRNVDLAFTKDTKLTERVNLQLRLNVFNVFNHANFANPLLPNSVANWAQNGIDATGRGVGFLPLTATPDVGAGNPFLGNGGPRNLEIGARVTF